MGEYRGGAEGRVEILALCPHILKFNVPCPLPWILTSISAQVTRNMGTGANHGDGAKWCAVFERVEDPHQLPS